ncbi:MAG: pyruvate kinase [bacterium]|nr:pyruvate kinase [bacterium]
MKTINNKTRKTKIITTIGPASENYSTLGQLILAGANIFRFNLKHNTIKWHDEVIERARKVAKQKGKTIQILIDLPSSSFKKGIDLVVKKKAEYIALSNIIQAEEVTRFIQIIKEYKLLASVIVKIETKKALLNFPTILGEADAIMVARGDLGKAIPIEKVPFVQKELILACNKVEKKVIVATEMLLSMVNKKEPTRAEISDVANAVLEGSNMVMLSEETTIGKYPVAAVKIMNNVILEAESWKKIGHLEIFTTKDKKFKFGL